MITPINVGSNIDVSVHLRLPVSFFIVRQVVEQGKCNTVITIIQTAVVTVQPFAEKSRSSSG